MQVPININPNVHNPVYWHLRKYLHDDNIRYIYIYGGSSAAKTYSLSQLFLLEMLSAQDSVAVFRKESTTIDDTVYADFKGILTSWNLGSFFRPIKHKIRCVTGAQAVFKGMDDSEKAKGLSGFKYAYLNEVTKFDYEDYEEISRRLRGMSGQKIICDWNPISEGHWIKKQVVDTDTWIDLPISVDSAPTRYSSLEPEHSSVKINEAGDAILIKTTYRDNFWIVGHPSGQGGFVDKHVIAKFEKYKKTDLYFYNVYANGDWGHIKTGQEVFDKFKRIDHVIPLVQYDPNWPIHLSFDFNNLPYGTCLVCQNIRDGAITRLRVIDEICLPPPQNTMPDFLRAFEARFKNIRELYYTGDPSGKNKGQRKTADEAESYFEQVRQTFTKYLNNYSDQVPSSAPPIAGRRFTMNQILSATEDIVLEISPKCENLINDFETLIIDNNGGYQKKRVKNDIGQTYEEKGHCMDATIYWIYSQLPELFT